MNLESNPKERFEVSRRFRESLEKRIIVLERDAIADEQTLAGLQHADHIRRHRRLVAVQRAEALRMRLFLDRTQSRLPRPLIAL